MTASKLFSIAAFGACLALGLSAGCNIIGPIAYFATGPSDIPAAYLLQPDRTTVIFIDDRESHVTSRQTRALIGETAERELLTNGTVKDMVQCRNALQAALRERYGKPMTIVEIGKAVDAKVVIYATVDRFTLAGDGQTYTPMALLRVKVIDVASEQRLFPGPDAPSDWYPLKVEIGEQASEPPKNMADMMEAEQSLAKRAGIALARMFFAHQPPMDSTHLNEGPK